MNQKLDKLKVLLRELFQLDQPDLDFGIYRVLHAKSGEISKFMDEDLLPQVKAAFGQYKSADKAEIEKQIAELRKTVADAGFDPDDSPKVQELVAKLANESVDISRLEGEVYDHLFGFFRRYYSEGDFLSKRVYKEGVYAIPYEGEEVKLHWANSDQYYIKTSEYLRDYAFRLNPDANEEGGEDPMRVHLRLVDAAEGEHGNVKEGEGKNRFFILESSEFIEEENGELVIKFEFRQATLTDWPDDERDGKKKPPVRKDLLKIAEDRILATDEAPLLNWINELGKSHIKADGELADYSRLRAHLNRYSARNTFDYFVHKDLGGFLRRELDFYIKNEVMHLDDIESDTAPRVEQYLSKIKVIRSIAGKIIDFVAQLEDFQKKLWLKKKFVVETSYLIRVGIIPEEFYPEIIANDVQREEWINLFSINEIAGDMNTSAYSEPLRKEFLKAFPTLVLNTRLFDSAFVDRLLATVGEMAGLPLDGLLVHSENFQALNLLTARYRNTVRCIYIDPPYNTESAPILYKNDYRHSSWATLMCDRILVSNHFLESSGVLTVAIDDTEIADLNFILDQAMTNYRLTRVTVVHNPKGSITKDFNRVHEYALFLTQSQNSVIARAIEENETPRKMRRWGENSLRTERPQSFYPIYISNDKIVRVGTIPDDSFHPGSRNIHTPNNEIEVWPIDGDGIERRWNFGLDSIDENLSRITIEEVDGTKDLFLTHEITVPKTVWYGGEYDAGKWGNSLLINIIGKKLFDFPKSLHLVKRCVNLVTQDTSGETVLDYFAGSGTTAHAVMELNRADNAGRKFVLVETGSHFDSVVLPRVTKIIYSPEWKDAKPKRSITAEEIERSPNIVKVLRLESYEDALNNLELKRTDAQEQTLFGTPANAKDAFREQYMLRYMLDVESRGSQSLLNVVQFADPTAYKLKVKRPGSDESRVVSVDLLETFNWLIGLTVGQIAAPVTFSADFERDTEGRLRLKGRLKQDAEGPFWFRTVSGTMPDGRRTLVIWRKRTGQTDEDNLALDEWFTRQGYSSKDSEFDLIYVNGGNNLENLRTADDLWKVRLIEEDFHRLMFDTKDV